MVEVLHTIPALKPYFVHVHTSEGLNTVYCNDPLS